tara:strand:+ start:29681 stop:30610 length:930 start_codon:yes stop_codon:yes gene_type:complete
MKHFSIIIPLYNNEKDIKKIFSHHLKILNDLDNIRTEVIYIDNCSDDKTYKILKEKIKLNKSFKIFKSKLNESDSPGLARNIGIKKAKSKYLLFLDTDDKLKIKNVKKFTNIILRNKYSRIFLKKKTYLQKKRYLGKKNLKFFLKERNDTESIGIIFLKKKLLKNNIFFKKGFFEDVLFTLKHSIELNGKDYSTNSIEYLKNKNKNSITVSNKKLFIKSIYKIKAWRQVDLYLKNLSPKILSYKNLLPDIQYRIRGEFFNELKKIERSNLGSIDKSKIIKTINILLNKYVLKDFKVLTKKDLFIKKHQI